MKSLWVKRIACVLFFALLLVNALSLFFRKPEANGVSGKAVIDLAQVYPFKEKQPAPPRRSLAQRLSSLIGRVDNACNRRTALLDAYRYTYGLSARLLGKARVEDLEEDVYRLDNGWLTYLTLPCEQETLDWAVENLRELQDFLAERDGRLLVVFPLAKDDEIMGQLPRGVTSYRNRNTKAICAALDQRGIPCMDMAEESGLTGQAFYDMFFRTDHHFTHETGFAMAARIAEKIRALTGQDLDEACFDRANYRARRYEGVFMGSQGRKVTRGYGASREDLTVLTPTFETSFRLTDALTGTVREGNYEQALLDQSMLTEEAFAAEKDLYRAFMWGDRPLKQVENLLADNELRILVIRDSKAAVITPFLACAVRYLDIIDSRHFQGSIQTFIQQNPPDLVLVLLHSPGQDRGTARQWRLK